MKIGILNISNFEQEVEVGDKVRIDGYTGEVLEIIEPDKIKVKYLKVGKYEHIETWTKDCVHHLDKKENI